MVTLITIPDVAQKLSPDHPRLNHPDRRLNMPLCLLPSYEEGAPKNACFCLNRSIASGPGLMPTRLNSTKEALATFRKVWMRHKFFSNALI